MHKRKLLEIDLKLFDGAAGGASAGEGAEGASAEVGSGLPKADNSGSSRRKSGAFDNVVFGKQDDDSASVDTSSAAESNGEGNANTSGISTTSNTLEERRKAFEDMINGEYKDLYAEKFQTAMNRRTKEAKSMERSLEAQKPIMDMLAQRYNIADGDAKKVLEALESDTAYWEEIAEAEGLTVEQYKAVKKLERENEQLRLAQERAQGQEAMQTKLNEWYSDGEKLKEIYPTFDLRAEAQNEKFISLLEAGISVKQAYELVHMEEIKNESARVAAQTVGQQMAARAKEKASRPKENGTSSQSAVVVMNDVNSLSDAALEEVARRVKRGEKINF